MTRFNLQNKIGQGKIVQLILEVDIDDVTTIDQMDVYLEIEGVELVLNNNTAIPVGISNNTITLYRNDIDAVVENEHIFSQINLYPNPAKDNLNINFTSFSAENINIKVIDILGKTILIKDFETQQGENNFTLNVKDLPSGTYFLEIENGFENTVQKFMIW